MALYFNKPITFMYYTCYNSDQKGFTLCVFASYKYEYIFCVIYIYYTVFIPCYELYKLINKRKGKA